MDDRDRHLARIADNIRAFLAGQTDVELLPAEGLALADLPVALERLDLALGQLADLATVYGDDSRGVLDPLVVPAATLVGAYLCAATGAVWAEPDPAAADELVIILPGQPSLDLLGLTRLALGSGAPNLAALVQALASGRP